MSLALYRKYRPGQLADVIGQDHVTVPLARALDSSRVHHAYLFTGPRGCGKTSSARIMARSMNCEVGITSAPCGACDSCVDLAPNGVGSIDVIEIDAATYRGIEDAKELRERAVYAPVKSRFKIYIIDEAHQLTKEAFNVLLKLVEEPPPHLRFIFATTEADKIIPTLRSRTHNYAFRLVSARALQEHLANVCQAEGVKAEPAALALVARAGAGSVRDSMSVLGQVIGGSGPEGITYADTVAQLGFTDEVLLSRFIEAIAAGDGAAMFTLVDQVVVAGNEPRRFAMDLLERLRDLIVVSRVPDAAASGMFDVPQEQVEDLVTQAKLFTHDQMVRVADLVSAGLHELRGASSPRLQLELLAARLVTPQVAVDLEERVARLERGGVGSGAGARGSDAAAPAPLSRPSLKPQAAADEPAGPGPASAETPVAAPVAEPAVAPRAPAPKPAAPAPTRPKAPSAPPPMKPSQVAAAKPAAAADETVSAAADPAVASGPIGTATLESVRANWPTIVAAVNGMSKVSGALLSNSAPVSLHDGVLAIALPNQGMLANVSGGQHLERFASAVESVCGARLRIDPVLDPGSARPVPPRDAIDTGDADPEDKALTNKSAIDLVTEALGGRIISENPSG